jgi:hypothetical protein
MAIEAKDVEQLIIDKECPETLILSGADFKAVYDAYRVTSRDTIGVYIAVLNTKVRPTQTPKAAVVVDLSKEKTSVFAVPDPVVK